jgi:hypothetical protein
MVFDHCLRLTHILEGMKSRNMCGDFFFKLISEERVTFTRLVTFPGLEVLKNIEEKILT